MPDTSAVVIDVTVPGEQGYGHELATVAVATLLTATWEPEGYEFTPGPGGTVVQLHDYDCPWGDSSLDEDSSWMKSGNTWATLDWLVDKFGCSYTVVDYGHYTWDGSTSWRRPGMEKRGFTTSGVDGTPYADKERIVRVLADLLAEIPTHRRDAVQGATLMANRLLDSMGYGPPESKEVAA